MPEAATRPDPATPGTAPGAAAVEFRDIEIRYGKFIAVSDFSLRIDKGSFVTLLGPSGCGKTTILRSLAGLVEVTAGQISIGGRRVDDVPIYKRNIGLVFQNYALFPHKTVFDNVAFGLKYRNVPRAEIAGKVARALEMVRLPGTERKLPSELSGGQQQRIALARAIIFEPEVLLMDEPLSALDANMREEMRVEIKKIQRETGITAIFVTHDQEEALSMSDRIVVMNAGRMEQVGTPQQVYDAPATGFVADFLGKANMLPGQVTAVDERLVEVGLDIGQALRVASPRPLDVGARVTLVIRPQKLTLVDMATDPGAGNRLQGHIASTSYLGSNAVYEVDLGAGAVMRANLALDGQPLAEGAPVALALDPEAVVLLDAEGRRIG